MPNLFEIEVQSSFFFFNECSFCLCFFMCHSPTQPSSSHLSRAIPLSHSKSSVTVAHINNTNSDRCTLELHWCKGHSVQCKNHSGWCRDCSVWYQKQDVVALALDTWDMECTGRTWYKTHLQRNKKSAQYLNPPRAVIQGRLRISTCKLTDSKHVDYPSNLHLKVQSSCRGIGNTHR